MQPSRPKKLRVLVIGTNKAFKQLLVNSLFSTKMYFYNTVDRQYEYFVFRDAPKESVSEVTLSPNQVEFRKRNNSVPLADNNLVCSYFTYFYAQRKSREVQSQTTFLIDCKLTIPLAQQILDCFQLIDLPHLNQHKNQKELFFGSNTLSTITPDLILIAMHESQYFKQNTNNIKRALFANHLDPNFGDTPKMWVVKTNRIKMEREDMPLWNEMDMFYQWQGEREDGEFREVLAREVSGIYERKYILGGERVDGEEDVPLVMGNTVIEEEPDVEDTTSQATHPLFLSKAELKSLPTSTLQQMHTLLSLDPSLLRVADYNTHMQKIGYSKRITLTSLDYTKQIFLFILLGLITVWTGYNLLLIFAVLIALAAIERTRQNNRDNEKHITEEKRKHKNHLYGRDGPVGIKKLEIERELKERGEGKE